MALNKLEVLINKYRRLHETFQSVEPRTEEATKVEDRLSDLGDEIIEEANKQIGELKVTYTASRTIELTDQDDLDWFLDKLAENVGISVEEAFLEDIEENPEYYVNTCTEGCNGYLTVTNSKGEELFGVDY
jgi:hypothetical protein